MDTETEEGNTETEALEREEQGSSEEGELGAEPSGEEAESTEGEPEPRPEEPKEISFTPEQQEVINGIISRKTAKLRDREREAARLQEENESLKKRLPRDTRPEIPPVPDPYDDKFAEKMQARDEALKAAAHYEAQQRDRESQEQARQRELLERQQGEIQQVVSTYSERAKKLQVREEDLQVAGAAIKDYGISNELAGYILRDDKGPLITMHLAKSPADLEKVLSMDPISAAVYIASSVKPKLSGAKRAPAPPPDTLNGGGAPPRERGPKGARFE